MDEEPGCSAITWGAFFWGIAQTANMESTRNEAMTPVLLSVCGDGSAAAQFVCTPCSSVNLRGAHVGSRDFSEYNASGKKEALARVSGLRFRSGAIERVCS